MTPAPEGASAAEATAAVSSSSDDDDDAEDDWMMMAEEAEKGNGIGTAVKAAALQELIGRAIGQVQGLTRGEKVRK